MEGKSNSFAVVLFGCLLSASIIASAFLLSNTFLKVKSLDNTLSVTGSTRYKVVSDTVKWNTNISRSVKASNFKTGYTLIAKDLEEVKAFLISNGVAENEIEVSTVSVEKDYSYNSNEYIAPEDRLYTFRQNITITSKNVDTIEALAKNTAKFSELKAGFYIGNLEFYYSNLPELRISLLSDAIKDAKDRANRIAESNNQKAGSLKAASMGSVLVLSPESNIDNSDWGSYDTSTKDKEIMVTVKATFILE